MKKLSLGLICIAPLAALALMRWQTPDTSETPNKVTIQNGSAPKPEIQNLSLAQADNNFGVKLLQVLAKQDSKSNVVISPTSLAVALQMTYNGADGKTAAAMAQTLQIGGLSLDGLNTGNAALLKTLANPEAGVELHVANSLWTRASLTPLPDFVARNQSYYGATLGDLSGGAEAVNGWVSEQTKGKIPTIITPDDAQNSDAILANAVYFKGAWTKQFKTQNTKTEPFTPLTGAPQNVPMMNESGEFRYFANKDYQAADLNYGRGPIEMTVLLPTSGVKFADFIARLTPQAFAPDFKMRYGNVGLPRFKTEYGAEMKTPLSALGMGVAFDAQKADFSKMFSGGKFYIGFVKHKTYLDVNEAGTEAAAATAVGMTRMAMPAPQNPFTMKMNRPFVFAIRDTESGAILFIGAVTHI